MCDAKVLSQRGASVVSRCSECQCVFIWNHNIILSFSPLQFTQFKDFSAELDFETHSFPFPDGEDRMVMRTPADDIQFTFTSAEWEDFHAAMGEASYMLEVYSLMEGR